MWTMLSKWKAWWRSWARRSTSQTSLTPTPVQMTPRILDSPEIRLMLHQAIAQENRLLALLALPQMRVQEPKQLWLPGLAPLPQVPYLTPGSLRSLTLIGRPSPLKSEARLCDEKTTFGEALRPFQASERPPDSPSE